MMMQRALSFAAVFLGGCHALQQSDFLVKGLEEIEPAYGNFSGSMYSGLIPIDKREGQDGALMFWLFAPKAPTVSDTIVVWFNGGPGCSSFHAGTLLENSPVTTGPHDAGTCCMGSNDPLIPNPYAWTVATNMLYVEQPVGTGFSYGPEPQNEDDLSGDFYSFFINFNRVFDQFANHKLYLFGESYAGMYVPSIAHRIYLENKKAKSSMKINLDGIGIGNGWMDASVQGPAIIDYAWFHGMIDSYTRDAFHEQWKLCYPPSDTDPPKPYHPFTTPDECGMMEQVLAAAGAGLLPDRKPNTYDVTTFDPYAVLGDPNSTNVRFFNNPKIKQALNAPMDVEWLGCIPGEGRRRSLYETTGKLLLDDDKPISVVPYVADLLDKAGIRVLIYNGDRDMSCCAQGTETLLNSMDWSGADQWKHGQRGLWLVDGEVAGYSKRVENLEFVVVYNSGHLVPYNQPANALDLVTRFLQGQDFCDTPIPSFTKLEATDDTVKVEHMTPKSGFSWIKHFVFAAICFIAGVFASYSLGRSHRREYELVGN